jgi:hypothetical protein
MQDQIVHIAIENLQASTGIKAIWKEQHISELDGKLQLNIEGNKINFFTEIKKEVRKYHLPQMLTTATSHQPFMLIAGQIAQPIKEVLQQNSIAWLEANGNIYVKQPGMLLWVNINKPYKLEKDHNNRAFAKTGLKLVFLFLQNESLLNTPYRQLAAMVGTGIGNITNIINGLKVEGFLLPVNKKGYKLQHKKELLDKWIAAYEARLKPDLKLGTFKFMKEEDFLNWQKLPLYTDKTWWGGEAAGALYTNYLKPGILTLYTEETRTEIIKHYRLIPDPNGNVQVYKKFWFDGNEENYNKVPPLLAYADLVSTNDRRCIETAQKLYNEYLQDRL